MTAEEVKKLRPEGPVPVLDQHKNLNGEEFDLGKNGQFIGYTVVIG